MSKQTRLIESRAVFIQSTLGTRTAAGFLRNRGASLQEALMVLVGRCVVRGGL